MIVSALIGLMILGIFETGRRSNIGLLKGAAWFLLIAYAGLALYGAGVLMQAGATNGMVGQGLVGPSAAVILLSVVFIRRGRKQHDG